MADYLGSEQNRVLEVKDRSIDNVVFQYKHPPLTSEWNLINQVGNEKIQSLARVSLPSGWINVGDISQDGAEADATSGSVYCSEGYTQSTSFKLFSLDDNYAVVNGWPILVQGWGPGSTLSDNIIKLDAAPNQYNNFVFLEVWRKLVGSEDTLYKYGNVERPYSDNEIEWNVIGSETTKRVQIQYRIRSIRVSSLSDSTKEVFDTNPISPIGGRTSEAVLQSFHMFGASDPGLYVAGDGSDAQKEYLGTVDGYVYAIPMFIVYRRNKSEFLSTLIDNTIVTKEMSIEGYRSDRPDGKLVDVIYKDDIVDLRHCIQIPGSLKDLADTTISKLMSGSLGTSYKKSSLNYPMAYSGGSTLLTVGQLSNTISSIPKIGVGSEGLTDTFKRRSFCNAEITHDHNVVEIKKSGTEWVSGTFTIASKVTLPSGEIVSVDGFYSPDQGLVSGVSSDGVSITIEDTGDYPIVGTTNRLYMEFTFKYASSPSTGFVEVPNEFIEVNKNDSVVIATKDNIIPLRYNNSGELLNFGASSGEVGYPGDIDIRDFVRCRGGDYTEQSNFGHELVLHRKTNSSGIVNIGLTNSKYNQYYLLGVKSIEVGGVLVYFTAERIITISPYAITNYILTMVAYPDTNVIITFYTGSKFINDVGDSYSVADSVKFFDLSKQGRGITDTYEVIEAIAEKVSGDYYIFDTGDKPIIKLATTAITSGDFVEGTPFAYPFDASGTQVVVLNSTDNYRYPILGDTSYTQDFLPTMMIIQVTSGHSKLRVPVLVHSYVTQNEAPYNVYFKTSPYQGLLNTTSDALSGKVIGECTALITSSGSGAISDYSYSTGTADFTYGSRVVLGTGTMWRSYVVAGDYIRKVNSNRLYRILSVDSVLDTKVTLAESYYEDTETTSYEIVRFDIPNAILSNIVDRLPAAIDGIVESSCYSDSLMDTSEVVMTSVVRKLQDPLNALTNDFILGNSAAKRGRSDFQMTIGGNPLFKVGSGRPYLVYPETSAIPTGHSKKVYQFYLFMQSGKSYQATADLMGKIYLMVVAGETADGTKNLINPFSNKDVVDIFELVGRPIIRG